MEETAKVETVEAVATEAPASAPNAGGKRFGDRPNRGEGGPRREGRGPRRERQDDKPDDGIKTKLVQLRRVTKVVKGGRNMRFSAIVVAGDCNGSVGFGMGKAAEVPEAIRKAEQAARKNMAKCALSEFSIPHEAIGEFSASKVYLRPAPEGTGLIAGGSVRAVLELAGIKNITTKSYGSRNPVNTVKATVMGLYTLRSPEKIAALRGKTLEQILS